MSCHTLNPILSHETIKTLFTICKYLHLVPEIFKFEKCVKYTNEMTDDLSYIFNPILSQVYK